MATRNYLDFAEKDYDFFSATYNDGYRESAQGALAQNICEKYLKHIIDKYMEPVDDIEEASKTSVLKTHSLKRLTHYITSEMGIDVPTDVKNATNTIDGFYYSMRYPGDDSYFATPDDIEDANVAVERTRDFVTNLALELEENLSEQENDEEDIDDR